MIDRVLDSGELTGEQGNLYVHSCEHITLEGVGWCRVKTINKIFSEFGKVQKIRHNNVIGSSDHKACISDF